MTDLVMLVTWCFQKASPLITGISVWQNTVVSIEAHKCLTDYEALQSFLFVPPIRYSQNVPSLATSSIAGKPEEENRVFQIGHIGLVKDSARRCGVLSFCWFYKYVQLKLINYQMFFATKCGTSCFVEGGEFLQYLSWQQVFKACSVV
jgi:hypothetical protein